jgi:hypothetical protein
MTAERQCLCWYGLLAGYLLLGWLVCLDDEQHWQPQTVEMQVKLRGFTVSNDNSAWYVSATNRQKDGLGMTPEVHQLVKLGKTYRFWVLPGTMFRDALIIAAEELP